MIVADLGSGSGFYTMLVAKEIPQGVVYAVDIDNHFLKSISNHAHDLGLDNIRTIHADLENPHGSHLKDELVDVVIVSNILFQIQNKENFIKEIFRILKKEGKVLFTDFHPNSIILGKLKNKILSKQEVLDLFLKNNFILDKEIFAGEHNYAIILNKKQ